MKIKGAYALREPVISLWGVKFTYNLLPAREVERIRKEMQPPIVETIIETDGSKTESQSPEDLANFPKDVAIAIFLSCVDQFELFEFKHEFDIKEFKRDDIIKVVAEMFDYLSDFDFKRIVSLAQSIIMGDPALFETQPFLSDREDEDGSMKNLSSPIPDQLKKTEEIQSDDILSTIQP